MKIIGLGLATIALGLLVAGHSDSRSAAAGDPYPAGCTVAIAGAPGYLPRAELAVENRGAAQLRLRLAGHHGLPIADLGTLGRGERRHFAHVLSAGRNLLHAVTDHGETFRVVLVVANHGAATCQRRYLWQIG